MKNFYDHKIEFFGPQALSILRVARFELDIHNELPTFGRSDKPKVQIGIVTVMQCFGCLNPIFHR